MILRKPYAFFIKHFKLIHMILALLMLYTIYRTERVLEFFNEYAMNVINVAGQDLISSLLYGFYAFVPILIILFTLIILAVMIVKKKPTVFYIVNILIFIFTFVIIQVANNTLYNMQQTLLDVRTIRLVRDLISVSFILQIVSFIITLIRATGFDVKKFGFRQDLKELEIDETDREEFEVQLSIDSNKTKRNLRKFSRKIKYTYLENKKTILVVSVIAIISVAGIVVYNILNRKVILKENEYFYGNHFTLNIERSYLTNTDYRNRVIDKDYVYVILNVKIKNNTTTPSSVDVATMKLLIDNYIYTPTIENKDSFIEFGNIYQGEDITNDYENKTLLYKIPVELKDKDMIFSFVDKNIIEKNGLLKRTEIALKPYNLMTDSDIKENNINDTLTFEDSIIDGASFVITSVDIQKEYKIAYNFCVKNDCIESFEYVKPSINSNYDKVLLKLTGKLDKKDYIINDVHDLYDFIEDFGTLKYVIDGKEHTQPIKIKQILPKNVKQANTYYIEVVDDVMEAESMSITLQIRNKTYKYLLK